MVALAAAKPPASGLLECACSDSYCETPSCHTDGLCFASLKRDPHRIHRLHRCIDAAHLIPPNPPPDLRIQPQLQPHVRICLLQTPISATGTWPWPLADPPAANDGLPAPPASTSGRLGRRLAVLDRLVAPFRRLDVASGPPVLPDLFPAQKRPRQVSVFRVRPVRRPRVLPAGAVDAGRLGARLPGSGGPLVRHAVDGRHLGVAAGLPVVVIDDGPPRDVDGVRVGVAAAHPAVGGQADHPDRLDREGAVRGGVAGRMAPGKTSPSRYFTRSTSSRGSVKSKSSRR